MLINKIYLLFFYLCLTWSSFGELPAAYAQLINPALNWQRLNTQHFEIIFSDQQKDLAPIYAAAAEKAYSHLQNLFQEAPSEMISILITDHSDLPNGSATFLPYFLITALPVLPTGGDSLSYYENWVYELLIHELAHVFTMTPRHGFYTPLKYVFGSIIHPNGLLPTWYLEGLAVEVESRYTTHGRLKSPSTMALVRALTQDAKWSNEDLAKVNESTIPWYPFNRPYVFGSFLWHSFVEKKGEDSFYELNQRYSRRLPFLVDKPLQTHLALKSSLDDYWEALKAKLAEESRAQIQRLHQSGVEKLKPILKNQESQSSPSISPQGEFLAFLAHNVDDGTSLRLIRRKLQPHPTSFSDLSSQESQILTSTAGTTRLSWSPDSTFLVYDKIARFGHYNLYRDLFMISIPALNSKKTAQEERLTFGERATEPTLSPSGRDILYVRQKGGKHELVLLDRLSKKMTTLISSDWGVGLSHPEYLDSQRVIFSEKKPSEEERLFILNLKDKTQTAILKNYPNANMSRKTSRGLIFTSSKNGTNNLYLTNADLKNAQAISNTTSEVGQGDLDPLTHEIISSRLTGDGFQLFSSPLAFYDPPQLEPLPSLAFQTQPPPLLKLEPIPTQESSYSPWKYLWPRYWIPFIYPVENGVYFQGSTQMSDPLQKHNYSLMGTYDSVTRLGSYGASYTNLSNAYVGLTLKAAETHNRLAGREDSVTSQFFSLEGQSYLSPTRNDWIGVISTDYDQTQFPTSSGNNIRESRFGPKFKITYSSEGAEGFRNPQKTQFFASLEHTFYLPGENRLSYNRSALSLGGKWKGPLPRRHFISATLNGIYAPHLPLNRVITQGDRTLGGNYLVTLVQSPYVLRGYVSGSIVGRSMINSNLEYHFPIRDLYMGSGTSPWFFRKLEGTLFMDTTMVDGASYSWEDQAYHRTRMDIFFPGTGGELHLKNTVGYQLPLVVTLGLYYGLNQPTKEGFMLFMGLGFETE